MGRKNRKEKVLERKRMERRKTTFHKKGLHRMKGMMKMMMNWMRRPKKMITKTIDINQLFVLCLKSFMIFLMIL